MAQEASRVQHAALLSDSVAARDLRKVVIEWLEVVARRAWGRGWVQWYHPSSQRAVTLLVEIDFSNLMVLCLLTLHLLAPPLATAFHAIDIIVEHLFGHGLDKILEAFLKLWSSFDGCRRALQLFLQPAPYVFYP